MESLALPRLLVVDDEPNIRSPLARALSSSGYAADEAGSGHEAITLLKQVHYQLIVLDMHMPDIHGVEVMQLARQIHPDLLIVVLTGYATVESAIAAVKMEAVDYLRKPVTIREIVKTVTQAIQKNAKRLQRQQLMQVVSEAIEALRQVDESIPSAAVAETNSEQVVYVRPLTLDREMRQVTTDENPVQSFQLTEGEAAVLDRLMTQPGQVLSCRQLIREIWGYEADPAQAESVIRPYICRLRGKLEGDPKEPRLIHTVRKRGYLFSPSINHTH